MGENLKGANVEFEKIWSKLKDSLKRLDLTDSQINKLKAYFYMVFLSGWNFSAGMSQLVR